MNYSLDFVDVARQVLVRRVILTPAMATGASQGALGSTVEVGTKAYVTSMSTDMNRPAIAVVDTKTFKVMPIRLPAAGFFDGSCNGTPNAAATPDHKYVVMAQADNIGGAEHQYFISTATNQVVLDVQQNNINGIYGILSNPVNNPRSNYGYLLSPGHAVVHDLNSGSPTLGQQVPNTTVDFHTLFGNPSAADISPDGLHLVVGGFKAWTTTPNPNLVELDTALMLTKPSTAIVANAVVNGGFRVQGIAVSHVTTNPRSAPTVSTVSEPINNGIPNTTTATGTNFAPGARVQIGTMPPLPAMHE